MKAGLTEMEPLEEGEEDYIYLCLSFKAQDGSLKFFRSGGYINEDQVLLYGPDLINICRTEQGSEQLNLERLPASGIHVDEGRRTVEFWKAGSMSRPIEAIKKAWASYEVTDMGDNFEKQLERSEGRLAFRTANREECLERLRPIVCLEPVDYTEGQGLASRILLKIFIFVLKVTSRSKTPKLPSLSARRKIFNKTIAEMKADGQ